MTINIYIHHNMDKSQIMMEKKGCILCHSIYIKVLKMQSDSNRSRSVLKEVQEEIHYKKVEGNFGG